MATASYPLEDEILRMPNGETLWIIEGELPVTYSMCSPEPDIGCFYPYAEWDVDCREISVRALDGEEENEVRLVLPIRHPAVRKLLSDLNDTVSEYCTREG